MRTSLVLLAFAALLASPSGGENLRPLPWIEAGYGRLDGAEPGLVHTLCRRFSSLAGPPGLIEASGNDACPHVRVQGMGALASFQPLAGGHFELTSDLGSFEAALVSEVEGNTWTLGVRDMHFVPGRLLPAVGTHTGPPQFGWIRISLAFEGFASFDAPRRRPVGGVDVAVRPSEHFPPLNPIDLESRLLGAFPDTVLSPVSSYVAGDRLRLYAGRAPYLFTLVAKSLTDQDFVVQEVSVAAETPCGNQGLDDCTFTLELFEPGPSGAAQ